METMTRSLGELLTSSSNHFSRRSCSVDDHDEEALKWAALEKLPTFTRLRTTIIQPDELIDVTKLGVDDRQKFIDSIFKVTEEDNEKFLKKLRKRIDRSPSREFISPEYSSIVPFHEEWEDYPHINSGESIEMSQNVQIATVHNRQMTNQERVDIYHALLERSVDGKVKKTTTTEVSNLFSVPLQTVQRIWRRAKKTPSGEVVDLSHRRKGRCGKKKVQIDLSRVVDVPLRHRKTIRSLAASLDVSPTSLFQCLKEGLIKRHTNAIKPSLKEKNMRTRLEFCVSMVDRNTMPDHPKFVDMYNVVHIDEKWFYMSKQSETYYLLPDEEEPHRTCQSKNFIGKVMFLAAMARPRFDGDGNEIFSGKIGIFPFVTMQPAQRRSKNREAGTLELKPITSIKRVDIKEFLIEKVLPRIRERWPLEDFGKPIFIQQDNAKTHVDPRDEEFREAASRQGFDIRLVCQPSNSPDLNILDLGFFNSIQALQNKVCPKTIEELVSAVEKSFEEYSSKQVNRIFLTLQSCMQEIMKVRGANKYKIPHLKKAILEKEGNLPLQMACDPILLQDVISYLAS